MSSYYQGSLWAGMGKRLEKCVLRTQGKIGVCWGGNMHSGSAQFIEWGMKKPRVGNNIVRPEGTTPERVRVQKEMERPKWILGLLVAAARLQKFPQFWICCADFCLILSGTNRFRKTIEFWTSEVFPQKVFPVVTLSRLSKTQTTEGVVWVSERLWKGQGPCWWRLIGWSEIDRDGGKRSSDQWRDRTQSTAALRRFHSVSLIGWTSRRIRPNHDALCWSRDLCAEGGSRIPVIAR